MKAKIINLLSKLITHIVKLRTRECQNCHELLTIFSKSGKLVKTYYKCGYECEINDLPKKNKKGCPNFKKKLLKIT